MWTTKLEWRENRAQPSASCWVVYLLLDGLQQAVLTLDEWRALSATQACMRQEEPQAPYVAAP